MNTGISALKQAGPVEVKDGVPLRKAVVVLERVDDHAPWLALVPGDKYASRRSLEIGVLRRAETLGPAEIAEPNLLQALVDGGRTERIRRNAAATLKALPQ